MELAFVELTPAACLLTFQATMTVLVSLLLISGQTKSFYKMEPHTAKISMGRTWELAWGGHLLHWGAGMIAAVLAGGAQYMCILMIPGGLACTYMHYASGEPSGKQLAISNAIFMIADAYFGFVPMPSIPTIEWTPAAHFLVFQAILIVVCGLMFLMGPPDAYYKGAPHVKDIMSRQGELGLGGMLLGMGGGLMAAVIAGGAQDMCILGLPGLAVCAYMHYSAEGGMKDAITNIIFMTILAYLGFVR